MFSLICGVPKPKKPNLEIEIRFVVTRDGGWGLQEWRKVVKRKQLPVSR